MQNKKNELNKSEASIQKGIFWFFSTSIVWQSASWILTLLTARILSPRDYGLLAISDSFFPYLLMLCTFKIDEWLLQTKDSEEKANSNSFSILLLTAFTCTTVGIFIAPLIANYYSYPELSLPLQLVSLIFIPRSLRIIPEAKMRKRFHFKAIAIANLILGITRGLLQLLLAHLGFKYWSLVVGGIFFEVALTVFFIAKEGISLKLSWDREIQKKILSYGFYATGAMALWVIFSTSDNLIVGKLFGIEALGFYAMAFFLSDLPFSKLNTFLSPVLTPYYSKLKDHQKELSASFLKYNQLIISLVFPVYIFIILCAAEITKVFLSSSWSGLVYPLKFLCLLGIIKALSANVSLLFNAIGKPKYNFYIFLLSALVLPFSFYYLGRSFGLKGIFFTWLIIYPLIGPLLQMIIIIKELKINPNSYLLNILQPFTCTLIFAIPMVILQAKYFNEQNLIMSLALEASVAIIFYLLAYFVLFRKKFFELYFTLVPKDL